MRTATWGKWHAHRGAALVALCLVGAGPSRAGAGASMDAVAFLAGHWRSEDGATEEIWTTPAGGVMVGASRTVRADGNAWTETLRIERDGDQIVYVASPQGQVTARFPLVEASQGVVVFENPAHDFPQRIAYARRGRRGLVADVTGTSGDGPRMGFSVAMARVTHPRR